MKSGGMHSLLNVLGHLFTCYHLQFYPIYAQFISLDEIFVKEKINSLNFMIILK